MKLQMVYCTDFDGKPMESTSKHPIEVALRLM
jgi:hypothetical protein